MFNQVNQIVEIVLKRDPTKWAWLYLNVLSQRSQVYLHPTKWTQFSLYDKMNYLK